MKYVLADKVDFDARPTISRIFVDGFYQWLHYFSKDKQALSHAFAHMFDLSAFYVAVDNDKIAAITACTDGKIPPIHLDKRVLRKHLGLIAGFFAYRMLKKHLELHTYPFSLTPDTGSIEFVSTAPEYRGKGVAADLIRNIMDDTPYDSYVLEVADTNETAIRLYERLGFTEFMRVKSPDSAKSGVNEFVYMRTKWQPV